TPRRPWARFRRCLERLLAKASRMQQKEPTGSAFFWNSDTCWCAQSSRRACLTPPSKVPGAGFVDFRWGRVLVGAARCGGAPNAADAIRAQNNQKHADNQPPNPNFLSISAAFDASLPLAVARFMFQPATFRKIA